MMSRSQLFSLLGFVVALSVFTSTPLSAGGGAIGMVARTTDSSIGAHTTRAYTALFDGDRLVANGITVVRLKGGSQVVLAPQTVAAFGQGVNDLTVKLEQGTVTLQRTSWGPNLRVEAGEVLVVPASGFRTLGEVAMRDGMITVKATEGMMYLQGPDGPLQASKGKTITLPATRRSARAPQPGAGAGAVSSGVGFGKIGGIAAGGASAALGAASKGGGSSAGGSGSMGAMSFAAVSANANSNSASSDHEHNPTAVDQVANHVPDQACQHAASASVPWVACGPGSGR